MQTYERLKQVEPCVFPEMRACRRDRVAQPATHTSSGFVCPLHYVIGKGEGLRAFTNGERPPEQAWVHALHALCTLLKHAQLRLADVAHAQADIRRIGPQSARVRCGHTHSAVSAGRIHAHVMLCQRLAAAVSVCPFVRTPNSFSACMHTITQHGCRCPDPTSKAMQHVSAHSRSHCALLVEPTV